MAEVPYMSVVVPNSERVGEDRLRLTIHLPASLTDVAAALRGLLTVFPDAYIEPTPEETKP